MAKGISRADRRRRLRTTPDEQCNGWAMDPYRVTPDQHGNRAQRRLWKKKGRRPQ